MSMSQMSVTLDSNGLKGSNQLTQTAVEILATGFIDDPMFCFIFPDYATRLQALKGFFQPFVADGVKRGNIIFAPDEQGVCIWYPSEVPVFDDSFEEMLSDVISISSHFGGTGAGARIEHLAHQIGAYEPTVSRCEVLWITVLPEARGNGIGSSLIQPVLSAANTQKTGCYLVSSNSRNIPFYERHGFQRNCSIPISETYSMTGMWRDLATGDRQ